MWCNTAHQACVEGGQHDEPDQTTPKMDLAIHDIAHLVEELHAYHAIYSPLFQRREQREAAHYLPPGVAGPVAPQVDRADGAGSGKRRSQGRPGSAVL